MPSRGFTSCNYHQGLQIQKHVLWVQRATFKNWTFRGMVYEHKTKHLEKIFREIIRNSCQCSVTSSNVISKYKILSERKCPWRDRARYTPQRVLSLFVSSQQSVLWLRIMKKQNKHNNSLQRISSATSFITWLHYRVYIFQYYPFVIVNGKSLNSTEGGQHAHTYSGYCTDIMKLLAIVLNFTYVHNNASIMGLLPDTENCGLRMRRECRERFPRHRFQRKPLVSDPGMHHDRCVTHVPWCMSWSLTCAGGENVPSIPGTCATRKFIYPVRDLWSIAVKYISRYVSKPTDASFSAAQGTLYSNISLSMTRDFGFKITQSFLNWADVSVANSAAELPSCLLNSKAILNPQFRGFEFSCDSNMGLL